jgi:secretion/DNA translocation related TadE-like protein
MRERGSVSLVVAAAVAIAALLAALGAEVGIAAAVRTRAQTAADASALAAAQELIIPSSNSPAGVASEYADRHGARLVSCECEPGSSEVVVTVELPLGLPMLGQTRSVQASARAVTNSALAAGGTEGLQPWFVTRLACLFGRVPGIDTISGFRTRAQQAALYRAKPDLAAPPGHSNHEIGLAADLGYESQAAEDAAHRAAPSCGLRFPMSYEPWHVEPVGI